MKSLNSVGDARRTLLVAGIGMFIAFLFLAPLAVFAAGTVTITTDKSFYAGTQTIHVSGIVTPAPTTSGTSVGITISGPNAATVDQNQFVVSTTNGAYNGTFVTGGPLYTAAGNGTYTIAANYNGATSSAIFQYGNKTTTGGSGVSTTTTVVIMSTIVQQTTVTQAGVGTTTTVVQSNGGGGTTTVAQTTTIATTVVSNVTSNVADSTALAVGAVGLIVGIIALIMAVLVMRKK
jgi:hypothetical protein